MDADTPFDWGEHRIDDGGDLGLRLGPLRLRFARQAGEIRIAHGYEDLPEAEMTWTRWAPMPGWEGTLRLDPVHADRLVVVKPDQDFWLLREARARLYLRVPLHVRVAAVGPSTRTLLDVATEVMSDTWWGTTEEGELGYWLDTRGRRSVETGDFEEHLCICPLVLDNPSADDLHVDRIALRVAHLSIFGEGQRLWADETRVRYLGADDGSRIQMAGRAPDEAPGAIRLAGPREPRARGFTAWTFARLRSSIEGLL